MSQNNINQVAFPTYFAMRRNLNEAIARITRQREEEQALYEGDPLLIDLQDELPVIATIECDIDAEEEQEREREQRFLRAHQQQHPIHQGLLDDPLEGGSQQHVATRVRQCEEVNRERVRHFQLPDWRLIPGSVVMHSSPDTRQFNTPAVNDPFNNGPFVIPTNPTNGRGGGIRSGRIPGPDDFRRLQTGSCITLIPLLRRHAQHPTRKSNLETFVRRFPMAPRRCFKNIFNYTSEFLVWDARTQDVILQVRVCSNFIRCPYCGPNMRDTANCARDQQTSGVVAQLRLIYHPRHPNTPVYWTL